MAQQFLIYGLIDPRTQQLRYVGLHSRGSLEKRLREHLCRAKAGFRLHVYDWVRSLLDRGQCPEIVQLESVGSFTELTEAESWHIQMWRSLGCDLTNLTDGGEGCWGYRHTEESKAKMSLLKRGRPSPRLGVKHSSATKALISKSKRGVPNFKKRQTLVDQFGTVYSGQVDAANRLGVSRQAIGKALARSGVCRGLKFALVEGGAK